MLILDPLQILKVAILLVLAAMQLNAANIAEAEELSDDCRCQRRG